jgi:hypothetical protein
MPPKTLNRLVGMTKQNARRLAALEWRDLDHRVKPWGRWAMFGFGFTSMLIGQMTALAAVMWWLRAGARAVAEFGQRRRGRDPNRLYIDPGSGGPGGMLV